MKLASVLFNETVEKPGAQRGRDLVGLLQSVAADSSTFRDDLRLVAIEGVGFVAAGEDLYPLSMVRRMTRAKVEKKA